MSEDLAKIQTKLDAIPANEVQEPSIPMAIYHQEAHDLLTWLEDPAHAQRLLDVGLSAEVLTAAREALPGLRVAQSRWYTTWNGRKPEEQRAIEDEAKAARDEAFTACRWNLRQDSSAQQVLDRIADGEGVADLVADLEDLAALVADRAAAFAVDKTFDAAQKPGALRALAAEVRAGLSEFRTDTSQRHAVDLRNRAFTYVDDLLSQIRAAGRYALRNRPEAAIFASAYLKQKRGRRKNRGSGTDPQTP